MPYRRNQVTPDEKLEAAILNSDIKAIDDALSLGADVNLTKEHFEVKGPHYLGLSYPLWLAITEGVKNTLGVVEHLLKNGARPSDYKTYDLASKGSTLAAACQLASKSRYEIVKMLLEAGASPDEGRGAVYANIPSLVFSKNENQKLRELLDKYSKKKGIVRDLEI